MLLAPGSALVWGILSLHKVKKKMGELRSSQAFSELPPEELRIL